MSVAYQDPEDKWFEYHKIKPPERLPHLTEEEIEQRFERFRTTHTCQWSQRGNMISCTVDDYEHGQRIPTSKRLTGTDENGRPILVDVV